MAARVIRLLLVLAFCGLGALGARAESLTAEQYEAKLKTYDPAAVEAAQFYARTFDLMGPFKKSTPMVETGMARQLKTKNPDITEEQTKLFVKTFEDAALIDNAPIIERAMVVSLLDIFTKDELVALQQFYTSPAGVSLAKKYPMLSDRMNEARGLMKTEIVPRAIEAAKAKLKESGVEVKM